MRRRMEPQPMEGGMGRDRQIDDSFCSKDRSLVFIWKYHVQRLAATKLESTRAFSVFLD